MELSLALDRKCVVFVDRDPFMADATLVPAKRTSNKHSNPRFVIMMTSSCKWKHLSCHWPFVRGIHRSLVNSPHKGQWSGALVFSFIGAWIKAWANNRDACDLRRHQAHYAVTVMWGRTGGSGPPTRRVQPPPPPLFFHYFFFGYCHWSRWWLCSTAWSRPFQENAIENIILEKIQPLCPSKLTHILYKINRAGFMGTWTRDYRWLSMMRFCLQYILPGRVSLQRADAGAILSDRGSEDFSEICAPIGPISQIPECTCSISHNATFRTEMCTFLFWMLHCGIWNRCILGFVNEVNCDTGLCSRILSHRHEID